MSHVRSNRTPSRKSVKLLKSGNKTQIVEPINFSHVFSAPLPCSHETPWNYIAGSGWRAEVRNRRESQRNIAFVVQDLPENIGQEYFELAVAEVCSCPRWYQQLSHILLRSMPVREQVPDPSISLVKALTSGDTSSSGVLNACQHQ